MGTLAGLAWRNMWRNWHRTAITVVAIVLGLALLLFFDGMIRGADQAIFGNAVRLYGGNVLVHAPGYRERFTRLPPLALADEPTANLDTENGRHAMQIMQRLNQETGTAFVIATHDPRVMAFARRMVEPRDGRVEAERVGTVEHA
jgi:ABC-type transport system involved in cytochrome bd biosynthesis fused ATPase/permease subunit